MKHSGVMKRRSSAYFEEGDSVLLRCYEYRISTLWGYWISSRDYLLQSSNVPPFHLGPRLRPPYLNNGRIRKLDYLTASVLCAEATQKQSHIIPHKQRAASVMCIINLYSNLQRGL